MKPTVRLRVKQTIYGEAYSKVESKAKYTVKPTVRLIVKQTIYSEAYSKVESKANHIQ